VSTLLIVIKQERFAHLLTSYLKGQQIHADVVARSEGFCIELANANDYDNARAIAEDFIAQPSHPKYQQAAWQQGEHVPLHASSSSQFNLGEWLSKAHQAPFTSLILVVCTLIFVLSYLGMFKPIAVHLHMMPLASLWQNQEWWRLIGPVFIHFSAIHFIFNLLWWCMLGAQVERKMGLTMLLIVFVVSGVLSNIAQNMVSGPNFGGLSGVVYALMGFVWWTGWLRPHWGIGLPKAIVGFMLVWLVLGYTNLLWVNMANAAHTVGLLSGCLMAWLVTLGRPDDVSPDASNR
jgi:GlpG protein